MSTDSPYYRLYARLNKPSSGLFSSSLCRPRPNSVCFATTPKTIKRLDDLVKSLVSPSLPPREPWKFLQPNKDLGATVLPLLDKRFEHQRCTHSKKKLTLPFFLVSSPLIKLLIAYLISLITCHFGQQCNHRFFYSITGDHSK